eukprot:763914-Hanusia_phi.AAC.7
MKNTCKKLGVQWPTKQERHRLQEDQRKGGSEDFLRGEVRMETHFESPTAAVLGHGDNVQSSELQS